MRPRLMQSRPSRNDKRNGHLLEGTVKKNSVQFCPHSKNACEYFPKDGFGVRGRDIRLLMSTDPRDLPELFAPKNGGQRIPFPQLKDLCETCASSPHIPDTYEAYRVEKLDDINGPSRGRLREEIAEL